MTSEGYTTTPEQLLGQQPDILVILSDQERYQTH